VKEKRGEVKETKWKIKELNFAKWRVRVRKGGVGKGQSISTTISHPPRVPESSFPKLSSPAKLLTGEISRLRTPE